MVIIPAMDRMPNMKRAMPARNKPQSVAKVYLTKSFIRCTNRKSYTIPQMYNNVYDLQTLYLIIMFKSAPSEDKTPYGRLLVLWILWRWPWRNLLFYVRM